MTNGHLCLVFVSTALSLKVVEQFRIVVEAYPEVRQAEKMLLLIAQLRLVMIDKEESLLR